MVNDFKVLTGENCTRLRMSDEAGLGIVIFTGYTFAFPP